MRPLTLLFTFATVVILAGVILAIVGMAPAPSGRIHDFWLNQSAPPSLARFSTPQSQPGDAADLYLQAMRHFVATRPLLKDQSPPDSESLAILISLLDQARDRAACRKSFMDGFMPLKPLESPNHDNAPYEIAKLLDDHARKLQDERGLEIARSLMVFGHRMLELNQRLVIRKEGVGIGQMGATTYFLVGIKLGGAHAEPAGQAKLFADQMGLFVLPWQGKLEIIYAASPAIGDILLLARDDQDPTFRGEALLRLGAEYKKKSLKLSGKWGVEATVAKGLKDADPFVAQAAKQAQALTAQ